MRGSLPNLRLVIGAQKTATTSLYYQFANHPGIATATLKETKYFVDDELYNAGIQNFLNSFYPGVDKTSPLIDIDPELLFYPQCAQRIYDTVGPDARLVAILRNPVNRAYSHYTMERFRRKEDLPFLDALDMESERIKSDHGLLYHSYVSRGMYYEQVQRFMELFNDGSLKVLIFEEDFLSEPQMAYQAICKHFGLHYRPEYFAREQNMNPGRKVKSKFVDDLIRGRVIEFKPLKKFPIYNRISHAIRSSIFKANLSFDTPPLADDLRRELLNKYFLHDIERLETLLQRDLRIWKEI